MINVIISINHKNGRPTTIKTIAKIIPKTCPLDTLTKRR